MRTITILVLLLAVENLVISQIDLRYGDNITASISELGEVDAYQFAGNEGDVIWIRMRDVSKVDSHFKLYDEGRQLLLEEYDDGGLAEIKGLVLPQSGTFYLNVFDHSNNETGDYGLSLQKTNSPDYSSPLPCHINFTDQITSHTAVNAYHFDAEEGDVLYTQMRSLTEHLESEYFVYDSEGIILFTSERDGRMAKYQIDIPHTGRYYIFVTDKGGNDHDEFGFSLQLLNRHECYNSLSCGETETGELDHLAARNPYLLHMNSDESGLLQMRSPNPSVEISYEIYNLEGDLIATKTGSDKMIDAEMYSAEEATYLVIVQDKHGNDLGPYGMHYESITHNPCSELFLCTSQNSFEHTLDAVSQLKTYQINGVEGETYAFELEEIDAPLEPYIRMYDQHGALMVEKYSSTKVKFDGIFESTGPCYLLIGDKSGNDIGSYIFSSVSSDSRITLPASIALSDEVPCYNVIAEISGPVRSYQWSTGETTPGLQICFDESQTLTVEVEFEGGCFGSASVEVIVDKSKCDVIDFNDLPTGTVLDHELDIATVRVFNKKGPNIGTLFNSSDPSNEDLDLGTPNQDFGGPGKGNGGKAGKIGENSSAQGQLLIIAENSKDQNKDGLIDVPDDDGDGGLIVFDFKEIVDLESITAIDIEEKGGEIKLYNANQQKIKEVDLENYGDNSKQILALNTRGVSRMTVELGGSGAIDDIVYCISDITLNADAQDNSLFLKSSIASQTNTFEKKVYGKSFAYPNPIVNAFTLEVAPQYQEGTEIHIVDVLGRSIWHLTLSEDTHSLLKIEALQNAPSGVYFVQITEEDHQEIIRIQKSN